MTPFYEVMCFRLRRARELYRAGMIPMAEFQQRLSDLGYDRISIDIETMENEPRLQLIRRMADAER